MMAKKLLQKEWRMGSQEMIVLLLHTETIAKLWQEEILHIGFLQKCSRKGQDHLKERVDQCIFMILKTTTMEEMV